MQWRYVSVFVLDSLWRCVNLLAMKESAMESVACYSNVQNISFNLSMVLILTHECKLQL
jgi:hypothetical protein